MTDLISISDAAKKYKLADHIIRHYIRRAGVCPAITGTGKKGNPSLYRVADVETVIFAKSPHIDYDRYMSVLNYSQQNGISPHRIYQGLKLISKRRHVEKVKGVKNGRQITCYLIADLQEAVAEDAKTGRRAKPSPPQGNLTHTAKSPAKPPAKPVFQPWAGFPVGTRLRITNAAGCQWTGIFTHYRGDVFGVIRLEKGEMIFARDAKLEEVGEGVPLSPDDGFGNRFDRLERFYKYR